MKKSKQSNNNMKYKASEIVNRAKNLADISNTDFISFEEATQYLNDTFTEVFNSVVNHGEKVFVKEVKLNGTGSGHTDFDLPWDLYRVLSIRDPFSGYNLLRHTETESDLDPSYEIFNDKLRIYGATANLVLTYYIKPLWLTYPDKTLDITDIVADAEIVSTAGNNILLDNGAIYNILSKDKVGQIDLSSVTPNEVVLGNGHVFVQFDDKYAFINYNGDEITQGDWVESNYVYYDADYNVHIGTTSENSVVLEMRDIYDEPVKLIVTDENKVKVEYEDQLYTVDCDPITDLPFPIGIVDERPTFAMGNKIYHIDLHDFPVILKAEVTKRNIIEGANVRYGNIQSNGTATFVYSNSEETLLNLPNNIYFSLLAANLAIRFASKQNADISQLQVLYDNMQSTYLASLSQNADMPRIKNVY